MLILEYRPLNQATTAHVVPEINKQSLHSFALKEVTSLGMHILWGPSLLDRPFPNSTQSLFQSESKCEIFSVWMKTDIHIKDFTIRLVVKESPRGTRKLAISPEPLGYVRVGTMIRFSRNVRLNWPVHKCKQPFSCLASGFPVILLFEQVARNSELEKVSAPYLFPPTC